MSPIKRSAPHVVFLIDLVQHYTNGHDATVRWIQGMVLRILLYFLDSIDKRTTWGYRFFSSKTRSIAMTNQSFRPISTRAVHEFANDFSNRLKNEQDPKTTGDAPFTVVTRSLVQTLAEFHWSDIDLSSESPRRQWGSMSRGPQRIDIKNFTYLVTPAPHSLEALQQYMPGPAATTDTVDTSAALHGIPDQLAQRLQRMHAELRKWLWEDYANHRISLSWIDTASFDGGAEESLLCKGLSSILRPLGGTHIKSPMLMTHFGRHTMSFSEVFRGCTPRTVIVGVDTVSGKTTEELLELEEGAAALWTVPLLGCSKKGESLMVDVFPASRKTVHNMAIKELAVLQCIPRCQLQVSWLEHPLSDNEHVFVIAGDDDAFSSLVDDWRIQRHLAIARVVLDSGREGEGEELYAAVEPKINNTAVLRILTSGFRPSDVADVETFTPAKKRPLDFSMLDHLRLPATHAKKARLSNLLQRTPKDALSLAPLSDAKQQLLADIKNRRKHRRERIDMAAEAKLQIHSQPATPPPVHEEPAPLKMPNSAEELRDALRHVYLESVYTQKWLLVDAMKQMYDLTEHVLSEASTPLADVSGAVRSLLFPSTEFDTKHNHAIAGNREDELPEDERRYYGEWRGDTARTGGGDEHASRWCKALKIREGKMQMVLYILTIWIERQAGHLTIEQSQKELNGEVDLDNPGLEYQLCIYYDRSGVWEQVYDVGTFLHELEQSVAGGPGGFRIDPADVSLATFFHHMHQSLSNAAADWTQFLVDRSVEDELPDSQSLPGSQITSSQMSTSSFWDQPSSPPADVLSSQKSAKSIPLDDASTAKKRPSISDLPFMRREVDMSKRKTLPERTGSASSSASAKHALPPMRRTNSFTRPISSPPRKPRFSASQDQDSALVKLRQPLSPTTPRTRFERDFGFSMSGLGFTPHRHEAQSPSNRVRVAVEAEQDDNDDDAIAGARTPRRVRRLMMTPTRMRTEPPTPHRRPRRNITETLMAAATRTTASSTTMTTTAVNTTDDITRTVTTTEHIAQGMLGDDDDDDDFGGLFDESNPMPSFGDILSDDDEVDGHDFLFK